MSPLAKEVWKFIIACEAIQVLLAQGGTLTPDERALIEASGIELLSKVSLL